MPLFTILLVVIVVFVGKVDVGKFTLYELNPVNGFVPANEAPPTPPAILSAYCLLTK